MPVNITDAPIYQAVIQTVADGDAASGANFALAPQGLADRTAYLKEHIDDAENAIELLEADVEARLDALEMSAQYRMSGASVSAGNKFTLSLWSASGTFVLSSNSVQVPEAGVYLVTVDATAILDSSADYAIGLYIGGNKATGRRLTGPGSGTLYRPYAHLSHRVVIGTPASEQVDVRVVETTQSLHSDAGLSEHCTLTIQRLR